MGLTVEIKKRWPGFTLEAAFSDEGKILGLLGGSGSGKSMTLKCIAGLVRPDEGHIVLNGQVLFDSAAGIDLPPQQRKTGYLFQNYALFPHMTVAQNIQCGMRTGKDIRRLDAVLEQFRLTDLGNRYPAQLSGGQQQRAALARIVVSQPDVLMLDEPFSALDAYLREEMQLTIAEFLRDFTGTALVVSHDRDEIYRLCDQIAVYENGSLVCFGPKKQIFDQPPNCAAAILTGCRNVLAARPLGAHTLDVPGWGTCLKTSLSIDAETQAIGVRAHSFQAVRVAAENTLTCRLEYAVESPFEQIVYLRPVGGGERLCWKTDKSTYEQWKAHGEIILYVPPRAVLPLADIEKRKQIC